MLGVDLRGILPCDTGEHVQLNELGWRDSLLARVPWSMHWIRHRSDVGAVRRHARSHIQSADGGELRARVSLCITELGTNLFRHARNGRLLHGPGLLPGSWHVFSVDDGPGFDALHKALQDGWSSQGSMGTGLGAVRRLAEEFAVAGEGRTVIHAGLGNVSRGSIAVVIPHRNEMRAGDAWVATRSRRGIRVALFDGAGKGPLARASSIAACEVVRDTSHEVPLETTLTQVHEAIQPLRRPVVGSIIDIRRSVVRAVTVGAAPPDLIGGGGHRTFHTVDGLIGRSIRVSAASTRAREPGDHLVLRSDGAGSLAVGADTTPFDVISHALWGYDGRDDLTCIGLDLDTLALPVEPFRRHAR